MPGIHIKLRSPRRRPANCHAAVLLTWLNICIPELCKALPIAGRARHSADPSLERPVFGLHKIQAHLPRCRAAIIVMSAQPLKEAQTNIDGVDSWGRIRSMGASMPPATQGRRQAIIKNLEARLTRGSTSYAFRL